MQEAEDGNDLGGDQFDLLRVADFLLDLRVELLALDKLEKEVDAPPVLEGVYQLDHEGVREGFEDEELILHVLDVAELQEKGLLHDLHGEQRRLEVLLVPHQAHGAEGALS